MSIGLKAHVEQFCIGSKERVQHILKEENIKSTNPSRTAEYERTKANKREKKSKSAPAKRQNKRTSSHIKRAASLRRKPKQPKPKKNPKHHD